MFIWTSLFVTGDDIDDEWDVDDNNNNNKNDDDNNYGGDDDVCSDTKPSQGYPSLVIVIRNYKSIYMYTRLEDETK